MRSIDEAKAGVGHAEVKLFALHLFETRLLRHCQNVFHDFPVSSLLKLLNLLLVLIVINRLVAEFLS